MVEMMLLALLGGVFLALNRIFISRLGMSLGAFRSSYWNHLVGFGLLLLIMLMAFWPFTVRPLLLAPWWLYLGGAIGALFIALSSIVIPKIGATRALAMIISGQMTVSTLIDYQLDRIESPSAALLGLVLVVAGALIPKPNTG